MREATRSLSRHLGIALGAADVLGMSVLVGIELALGFAGALASPQATTKAPKAVIAAKSARIATFFISVLLRVPLSPNGVRPQHPLLRE
jgi:predicted Kef-type K+ transport protein